MLHKKTGLTNENMFKKKEKSNIQLLQELP